MEKTRGFKAYRFIFQLLALTGILSNFVILIYNVYNYKLRLIEVELMQKNNITHFDTGLVFIGSNIILFIFGIFGITSASKCLMSMFSYLSFYYNMVLALYCTYILSLYKIDYSSKAGDAVGTGTNAGFQIASQYIAASRDKSLELNNADMTDLINKSSIVHISSIFLLYLLILIIALVSSIKIHKNSNKPKISDANSIGMSKKELENKKAVLLVTD